MTFFHSNYQISMSGLKPFFLFSYKYVFNRKISKSCNKFLITYFQFLEDVIVICIVVYITVYDITAPPGWFRVVSEANSARLTWSQPPTDAGIGMTLIGNRKPNPLTSKHKIVVHSRLFPRWTVRDFNTAYIGFYSRKFADQNWKLFSVKALLY